MANKRSLALVALALLSTAAAIPLPALGRHGEPPCRSGVTLVTDHDRPPTPRMQTPRWGCSGPGVYVEDNGGRPAGDDSASEARAPDTLRIERLSARQEGRRVLVRGEVAPTRERVPVRIRLRGNGRNASRTVPTDARGVFATAIPVRSGRSDRVTATVSDGDGYRGSSRTIRVRAR